jgi:crotonobetainyl-CoA:carnitine CoA-transferase CaiB-like acyl-CoA transferase
MAARYRFPKRRVPLVESGRAAGRRSEEKRMKVDIGGEAGGPLAGIKVVDLSTIVSGPLCAQALGDFGADVVKVESPPVGDTARFLGGIQKAGMTGFFAQFNRNKRSVKLDLKSDEGREALLKLVDAADVLVENYRPKVMQRLGLGYETLAERNPRLVYVAINGFGSEGPYAERPAYDMVIQALSGFAKELGSTESPKLISNLVADKTSGLTALSAVLAALFARERTGVGQRVEVPMLDAFSSFVLADSFGAQIFGPPPEDPSIAENLYRAWPTKDGHVAIIIIEDHQFQALCRALGRDDVAEDPKYATLMDRIGHAQEMFAIFAEEIPKHTTAELVARAAAEGAPIGPVNGLDELLADPQAVANSIVVKLPHPEAGEIAVLRSAPRFGKTPSDVRLPPPMLGEHTEEVLREAGVDDAAIAKIRG